jgi:cytochrome c oxidase assembly protein subunit 15
MPHPLWATFTLFWVCVQGAFGALTVTMKLFPAIVTLHLFGALLLMALLVLQAVRYARLLDARPGYVKRMLPLRFHVGLWLVLLLLAVQIALGGWVSTNYAVLACTEFPLCQGQLWPEMDFAQAFDVWRGLGLTSEGDHINFAALTAIHYTHRLMAGVVIVALALLAWRLDNLPEWRRAARVLAALLVLQFLTGLSNVVLGWPLAAALLHTGGAAAMWVVLVFALATIVRPKRPLPSRLSLTSPNSRHARRLRQQTEPRP